MNLVMMLVLGYGCRFYLPFVSYVRSLGCCLGECTAMVIVITDTDVHLAVLDGLKNTYLSSGPTRQY